MLWRFGRVSHGVINDQEAGAWEEWAGSGSSYAIGGFDAASITAYLSSSRSAHTRFPAKRMFRLPTGMISRYQHYFSLLADIIQTCQRVSG